MYAILNGNKVFRVQESPTERGISCPNDVEPGWLYVDGQFMGPLQYAKQKKAKEINNIRAVKLEEVVVFNGNPYDADPRSLFNLTSVVSMGNANIPLPQGFTWRTADNQNIPMNRADLLNLSAAMFTHSNAVYTESWSKKDLIQAATTVQEVEAITWQ